MSIIKQSKDIADAIFKRITELNLTLQDVIEDAENKCGKRIHKAQLSRYLNHKFDMPTLTENDILWICIRYGIDVNLNIEMKRYDETRNTRAAIYFHTRKPDYGRK